MLDVGWSELLVLGVLALLVVGPKELPRLMRTVGQWVNRARSMAREFQRGMEDVAREADLEELSEARKMIDDVKSIKSEAQKGIASPTGWARDAVKDAVKEDVVAGAGPSAPVAARPAAAAREASAVAEASAGSGKSASG